MGWILEVEDRGASIDSLEDVGAFPEIDVALSSALTAVAAGDLGREMNRFVDDRARDGRLARGRQLLWVIYDWNRVSGECGSYYDLEDYERRAARRQQNRTIPSELGERFQRTRHSHRRSTRKVLFLKQLRKSQCLKMDLAHYDRLFEGDKDASYQFLPQTVRRHIELRSQARDITSSRFAHARVRAGWTCLGALPSCSFGFVGLRCSIFSHCS